MTTIKNSKIGMSSELDLFTIPATSNNIEEGGWASIYPTVALSKDTPIEFRVIPAENEYISLNKNYIYMKVSIKKFNSSNQWVALTETDACAPINNILHSMFSQIDLSFNNVAFETSNDTYPYKAYLLDLLNSGEGAKTSFLQMQGYYQDEAYHFEKLNLPTLKDDTLVYKDCNKGFVKRNLLFSNSGTAEFIGNLHLDIFKSNRLLLNNVEMRIKLIKSNDDFILMHKSGDKYSVTIDHIELKVRKCKIQPEIIKAHSEVLKNHSAKYPIRRTVIKPYTINSGVNSVKLDNINQGIMPNRLVIGMVDSDAFNGIAEKNPFNFKHYSLKKISLKNSGQEIVYYDPLQFDFSQDLYLAGYNTLLENIDGPTNIIGNFISRKEYAGGNVLFAYDLTSDLDSSNNFHLLKTGNLQIQLEWNKNLEQAITLIILFEYDNLVEINENRNVKLDYST